MFRKTEAIRADTLTVRQLRALRALHGQGTLTAAAAQLGLTVSAVHNQLRTLESGIGAHLVDRSVAGQMRLTPEGLAVLDAAETVEAAIEGCVRRVQALRDGLSGSVVLGAVSTGKYFAPRLVADLRRIHPGIEVTLRIGNRESIIGSLHDRSVELAVMGRPPREPAVVAAPIGPHPHLIVAAPDHPLAGLAHVPVDRLLAETFIAREVGSGTRILMMRYLDRLGDGEPYRFIEMDTNETIKQAVMAGLGIAFISGHTVTEELRHGRLVPLACEGLPINRAWFILHRADLRLHAALGQVLSAIKGMGGAFLPN